MRPVTYAVCVLWCGLASQPFDSPLGMTSAALPQSNARVAAAQPAARYAHVGDIQMFYEIAGTGPAIVFLHGGFGSSETWRPYFPVLADRYTVITPDSRGQGRTSLGDGPITYGRMAADAIGLLNHLGIAKAHFVGHSDGGCTLFHLLVDQPDRVLSATLIGAPYHIDNYPAEVFEKLKAFVANLISGGEAGASRLRAAFEARSPTPGAWPEVVRRLGRTWLTSPTFTDVQLRLIDTPVLIVTVNRDQFLPQAVFARTAALIPGSQMLNLGEATHSVPAEQPRELAKGIHEFIDTLNTARRP